MKILSLLKCLAIALNSPLVIASGSKDENRIEEYSHKLLKTELRLLDSKSLLESTLNLKFQDSQSLIVFVREGCIHCKSYLAHIKECTAQKNLRVVYLGSFHGFENFKTTIGIAFETSYALNNRLEWLPTPTLLIGKKVKVGGLGCEKLKQVLNESQISQVRGR